MLRSEPPISTHIYIHKDELLIICPRRIRSMLNFNPVANIAQLFLFQAARHIAMCVSTARQMQQAPAPLTNAPVSTYRNLTNLAQVIFRVFFQLMVELMSSYHVGVHNKKRKPNNCVIFVCLMLQD